MFGRLMCAVGLHSGLQRTNLEAGGRESGYHACLRCGTDRIDISPSHDSSASQLLGRQ